MCTFTFFTKCLSKATQKIAQAEVTVSLVFIFLPKLIITQVILLLKKGHNVLMCSQMKLTSTMKYFI